MATDSYARALAMAGLNKTQDNIIIYADAHTTKETYVVPVLTDEEITRAYNGVVAGKSVFIVDDLDFITIQVLSASNIDELAITILFSNLLVLTYKLGGEIVAVPLTQPTTNNSNQEG